VAGARELLDEALAGAHANARPDLVRRVTTARRALGRPDVPPVPADVREAVDVALHAFDSLEVDLRGRRAALTDPDRTARLWAELGRARQTVEDYRARANGWGQQLAEGFAAVQSDVEFRLLTGLRATAAESDRLVADGRGPAELDRWLRERVAAEAATMREQLAEGARRVADRVAGHLQLTAVPALPALPGVAPELPSAAPPPAPAQRRGATRVLTIGMPTYGGLMMGLVLPRIVGLLLPLWLLASLAVLAAGTLGGAALAVDRQQHRDLHRNQARTAVRGAVDDASMALGKQLRDTLRDLQVRLRDDLAAAATDRARELDRTLSAATRAAEAARDPGPALAAIAADLGELDRLRTRARDLGLPPARPAATRLLSVVPPRG
jgi:hypothetical protein